MKEDRKEERVHSALTVTYVKIIHLSLSLEHTCIHTLVVKLYHFMPGLNIKALALSTDTCFIVNQDHAENTVYFPVYSRISYSPVLMRV